MIKTHHGLNVSLIQSMYPETLVYTLGLSSAHLLAPKDTTPICTRCPVLGVVTKSGPPESPKQELLPFRPAQTCSSGL